VPNPVQYFEIIGPDARALKQFYAELFGWPVDTENAEYSVFEAGAGGGIDGGVGADQNGDGRVTVYARVDDLQGYLDKAERLGGTLLVPPTDAGGLTFAQFSDPAGNIMGVYTD
jgi:predicted enzyme related to lactoylglutathione lyase